MSPPSTIRLRPNAMPPRLGSFFFAFARAIRASVGTLLAVRRLRGMRPLVVLGLVLVVAGIAGLVIANVPITEHKTVLDAGPIKITEDQQRIIAIPTIASIA